MIQVRAYRNRVVPSGTATARLGKGAFSDVFSGTHQGKPVALKLCHAASERLMRSERRLLKRVAHPNIVRHIANLDAWDVDREVIVPGVVLELLMHGNLYEDMVAFRTAHPGVNPGLPPARLARVVVDTLRALSYLHSVEIRHRDVKPENLMWNGSVYVLIDFNCGTSDCTPLVGKYVQSLPYRAPENLLQCEIGVSSTFDEWATGCMLVEILLNRTLFGETTELEMLHAMPSLLGLIPDAMIQTARNPSCVKDGALRPLGTKRLRTDCRSMDAALQVAILIKPQAISDAIMRTLSGTLVYDPRQRFTATALLADL